MLFFPSGDNLNTAHGSDQYNPLWYVQTEAYDLQITTDSVSYYNNTFTIIIHLVKNIRLHPMLEKCLILVSRP